MVKRSKERETKFRGYICRIWIIDAKLRFVFWALLRPALFSKDVKAFFENKIKSLRQFFTLNFAQKRPHKRILVCFQLSDSFFWWTVALAWRRFCENLAVWKGNRFWGAQSSRSLLPFWIAEKAKLTAICLKFSKLNHFIPPLYYDASPRELSSQILILKLIFDNFRGKGAILVFFAYTMT